MKDPERRETYKQKDKKMKWRIFLSVLAWLFFILSAFIFNQYMTNTLRARNYGELANALLGDSKLISEKLKNCRNKVNNAAMRVSSDVADVWQSVDCIEDIKSINIEDAKLVFYIDLAGKAYLCGGTASGFKMDGSEIYDFSGRDFFKKAAEGVVYLGDPFSAERINGRVVPASAPITSSEKKVAGVIAAFYSEDVVAFEIEKMGIYEQNVSYIVARDNTLISISDNFSMGIETGETIPEDDAAFTSVNGFNKGAMSGNSVYGEFVFNNTKYIAVSHSLEKSDWNMVTAMPLRAAFDGFRAVVFCVVGIMLFAELICQHLIKRVFQKMNKYDRVVSTMENQIEVSPLAYISVKRDGMIIGANPVFLRETGYSLYDLRRNSIYDIIPENYANDLRANIYKYASNPKEANKTEGIEMPVNIKSENRQMHYVSYIRKHPMEDENTFQLLAVNVQRYKEYEEKMNRIVYYDSLTGFRNAVWLENHFNEIVAEDKYKDQVIVMIYIDIDNFKYINDMFGYDVGDKIIIELCRRMAKLHNQNATVCRRGGDEICIIVENVTDKMVLDKYLKSLAAEIEKEFNINETKHNITASIGVAVYPEDGNSYSDVFACADIAMNNAKENGKNSIEYFKKEMQESMYEIITMESDLKDAIENDEFVLYYQPQYNIETGKLYGFEALIRWISPKKGFVNPGKFISHAERTQMIVPIGDWILNEACQFANEAVAIGRDDICISVNVSVIQMLCADYTDRTLEIVKRNKTNPKNIKLEITESVFMDTIDEMILKIKLLNKSGLYFALDDFGTGYSSLNYLKKIPIKVLKIDKSFVDMIIDKSGNENIISSIINLAHDMDLQVVAEGIEDKVQLEWLRNRGCNIAQGYFTGKPMPKEEALKELHKNIYELDKNGKSVESHDKS